MSTSTIGKLNMEEAKNDVRMEEANAGNDRDLEEQRRQREAAKEEKREEEEEEELFDPISSILEDTDTDRSYISDVLTPDGSVWTKLEWTKDVEARIDYGPFKKVIECSTRIEKKINTLTLAIQNAIAQKRLDKCPDLATIAKRLGEIKKIQVNLVNAFVQISVGFEHMRMEMACESEKATHTNRMPPNQQSTPFEDKIGTFG